MTRRKICDGDVFIVFDLEWNQPIPGKEYNIDVSSLTGEIIEIGAVKLIYTGGRLMPHGEFSRDIRPKVYRKLHFHVKKVTHKSNADLLNGVPFEEAYTDFAEFCGEDAVLAGWGNSDTDMLKMNLAFLGMDDKLPWKFIDVQPLFSLFAGQDGKQRSVEFAVDYYDIPKEEVFHSATADAKYTARIMQSIFERSAQDKVEDAASDQIIDCNIKREYSHTGAPCRTQGQALSLVSGFNSKCPFCGRKFNVKIPLFRIRKSSYGLFECPKDGDFFGRTRVKKNGEGLYYAAAVLRLANQNDIFLIESKKAEFDRFGTSGRPVEKSEQNINKKCQKDDNSY